ncbi:hypothetical protein F5Y15DRAFT_134219 [Xylariaceae sp. FL0016]|nr:hypothetical protein F5Y15DRAFT_134219 [Xylariaceae sp. FL0016]
MARQRGTPKPPQAKRKDGGLPAPFKRPPDVLQPLIDTLDERRVYIIHIDSKPKEFKRKIFLVPCLMNFAIVALLLWRIYYIAPYYLSIFASVMGYWNDTTMIVEEMEWADIIPEVAKRAFTFMIDFLLCIFVWPWPFDFCFGYENGNPVSWRWTIGFQPREIIVRRSRKWAEKLGDILHDETCKSLFMVHVNTAVSPLVIGQKTGYLLMNDEWDLDWPAMVDAHAMVDKKMVAIEAFTLVVLVFREDWGWLCVDMKQDSGAQEDSRRRQVFAFRDALEAVGKDQLFYRWIEIIQYESSQPGGFGPEKQEKTAQEIREMFAKEGIDFDQFWKDSVGTDASLGIH